jgi:hypothetical protein
MLKNVKFFITAAALIVKFLHYSVLLKGSHRLLGEQCGVYYVSIYPLFSLQRKIFFLVRLEGSCLFLSFLTAPLLSASVKNSFSVSLCMQDLGTLILGTSILRTPSDMGRFQQ